MKIDLDTCSSRLDWWWWHGEEAIKQHESQGAEPWDAD